MDESLRLVRHRILNYDYELAIADAKVLTDNILDYAETIGRGEGRPVLRKVISADIAACASSASFIVDSVLQNHSLPNFLACSYP